MGYKLYGALGFGLGGIIVGLSGDYMVFSFILMGILGSAFIAIPTGNLKLTLTSGFVGGLSFFVGFVLPTFIFMTIYQPPFEDFIIGALMGLFGGAMIGMVYRSVKTFALWGMLGFGLGFGISFFLLEFIRSYIPTILYPAVTMAVVGIIGGIFMGHAASLVKVKDV